MAIFVGTLQNCKKKESIKIENPWVTESIPGAHMSAAYLTITNLTENDDTLLSIDCDEFEVAEFHSMTEENGVTKMDQMDYVLIKGGTKAIFEPGASHIMLVNNKHDLKAGQKITLKLHFQNAGLKTVLSIVKNIEEQAK